MPAAVILGVAAASGLTAVVGGAIATAIVGSAVSATVATVVGTAVIAGGVTAVQGGSASDVLKSAVLGGVTSGVGAGIASSIASDVAFNAIANGVSGQTAVIMGNALGGAAAGAISSGTSALLQGQDPIDALIKGGLTAGLSAGVNSSIYELTKDIPALSQPTGSAAGDAIQRAAKAAAATAILGGSGTQTFEKSLLDSFVSVAGSYIGSAVKDTSAKLRADADAVQAAEQLIRDNEAQQRAEAANYNLLANQLNAEYGKVESAKSQYDSAYATYQAMGGDTADYNSVYNWAVINGYQTVGKGGLIAPDGTIINAMPSNPNGLLAQKIGQVNTAADSYNLVTEQYNSLYAAQKPVLDGYQEKLTTLQSQLPNLEKIYTEKAAALNGSVTDFQIQESKNAALALKAIEDIAVAKEIYKADTGSALTDEELARFVSAGGNLVESVDKAYTSEGEARAIAQEVLGREPSEFDLMQYIGLNEASVRSSFEGIRYDEATFDSSELAQTYKDIYGVEPTAEWLASPEAMDMLGRSDAQGANLLSQYYTTDKNTVTRDEVTSFLAKAGLKETDVTQTQIDSALKGTEPGVETFFQTLADQKATTFDGSEYERQADAQAQAIRSGFNSYEWGGKAYTVMSPEQVKQLQADRDSGKNVGVSPTEIFIPVPGKTLEQQLIDAGNPEEYAYKQGDTITVVSKRLAVPNYNDTEAWNAFKAEKAALGGDNFQTFLTEQFALLEQSMQGAPKDSVDNVMANAAMFGYGKMAQLIQAFTSTGEAMGIPQAQRATNIAKQVQSWSNKLVDQGIQNAEAAVLANVAVVTKESIAAGRGVAPSDISTSELYAQKTAALFKQIPNNPLGVSLFLSGEAVQEIPLLVVSGGVGSVFKNVISKSVGMSAAVGTNVALNGAEGFGGNYSEVKQYLQKQGIQESQIEALAIKSGFEAMGASMLTAYIGDRALIKSFVGDLATDSFSRVIATNSTREWFLGNLEGSLQNMSAQIGKYGSIRSEDEWLNAGIMEGFAQKGIAAGLLTADALSQVVAKDYDGTSVTLKQIIDGEKTFDPQTIDKSFSYGTGVNLGDAISYHTNFITNPDITPDEYFYAAQAFRDNGIQDFTPQEISSIIGGAGESTQADIQSAKEIKFFNVVRDVAGTLKFNGVPAEQIDSIAKQVATELSSVNDAETKARSLIDIFNQNNIDPVKATDMAAEYTGLMTTAQVSKAVSDAIAANPTITPTQLQAAIESAAKNYATAADIRAAISGITFPEGLTSKDVTTAITNYMTANPGLSIADVATKITEATQGLATTEGVNASITNAIKGFATTQDIKDAISNIQFPAGITSADVTTAIKNYMTANPGLSLADVAAKVTEATQGLATTEGTKTAISDALKGYATTADINAAIANIKFPAGLSKEDVAAQVKAELAANPNLTAKDVTDSIAAYMTANPGITAAEVSNAITSAVSGLASQSSLNKLQADLSVEIQAAKDIGLQGDAALQAGLDSLSAKMGVDQAALLGQLGTTANDLKTQFAAELAASQTATAAEIASTKTALESAIADAKAAGLEGDAALKSAIEAVAADQQTSAADLLTKLGTTEASLKTEFQAGLAGVTSEISATRTALQDAIKAAQDIGLEGDAALKAAIESVAADQKTSAADLLAKLGTTEAALRSDMEAGLAGVATSIADTKTALEAAIADAKASGLEGDAALKSAIESVAADQKTNVADLLAKLGTTEANLKTEFQAGLAGVTSDILATRTALQEAIQAAKDIGLEGDAALRAAIESVAADQQTSAADLLKKLGTTETALRSDMESGFANVVTSISETKTALEAAIADAKASGLEGDAALKAAIEAVAADQKTNAAGLLEKLGTTESGLKTEFAAGLAGVSAEVVSTRKALEDAIKAAQDIGLKGDAALQAAIETVAADLGTTKADLLAQLGTTEQSLRTEMESGFAGVATSIADTKTALEDAIAQAKAAGLEGDAALKAAIESVAADQKTSAANLLTKLGTTEAGLKAEFAAGLAGVSAEVADARKALQDAIQAAQDIGLKGDAALKAGIDSVAASLGTTKEDLLSKIGTTEAALRTDMESGFAGVATSIADTKTALEAAIADAKASGLESDAALKAAIESVAADQKTSAADLLAKLGTTEASLKTEFAAGLAGVSAEVADTRKALEDAIQAALDIGLESDAALQAGIDSVAASLNTTKEDLLTKLGTTADDLKAQFATDLAQTEKNILAQVAKNEAAGMTRDAALQKAINSVAATQKTDAAALTKSISALGTTLGKEIDAVQADIAKTEKAILAQVTSNEAAGMSRDAALQKAINTVAATQKTDAATLSLKLSGLNTALTKEIDAVQADLAKTEKAILAQVALNEKAGLTRDAALQKAINTVAATQKTDAAALASRLSNTQTALSKEIGVVRADIAQTEKDILAQVALNEKAGLGRDAALQKAINTVAATQKTDTASILAKLNTTAAGVNAKISGLQNELAQTEKDILAQVAINEKAGMSRDAALQKAISAVAATQKTDAASLTSRISGLSTTLSKEIDAVQADIAQTEKDILAQVAINEKAGMTRDAALQKAINTVAATQKTDAATLTAKISNLNTNLTKEIDAVQADLAQTEKDILAQVAKNEAAGMSRDAALQKAISTVAATQKTDTASLLAKLGTTEAALKTQVTTQISGLDAKLSKAIADAKAAGLSGDAALQSAIGKVAAELNTTKSDVLSQVGKTEATLRSEMESGFAGVNEQYNSLSAAQKAAADALVAQGQTLQEAIAAAKSETAGQISGIETRLTEAIAAAEAMGLSRDQAITAAVESVAADLGTTKLALLAQLGTTEQALRTEFATGISGLEAQTKAQYEALTAEQKALADTLTAQGATLSEAIASAQAQTTGQIGALSADMQAKYNALTAEQKALANQLTQQGVDLNTAIATAQQQTQQQIANLGKDVDARINQLMQQGQTYQQATQQAFAEVNAKNQELTGLIGNQGRTANQSDIDVLTQMLGGQRSMDLAYDVTGDKQITQADIDFLTQVVSGTKTDWTAPQQSPWAATGLYGQIQTNEQRRQKDLADAAAAAEAQRQADQEAAAKTAAEQARQANIKTTASRAQTSAQDIMQQLESMQRTGMTPQPTPLVESSAGFDLSNPLNTGFFSGFQSKKPQQNQQPTTKIAAGGYIDDLLAEGMSVDDLMNLLR